MHLHEQEHGHGHDHRHEHGHSHGSQNKQAASSEEVLAMLEYMLGHNKHHAEELNGLAASLPQEEAELLHAAVADFTRGNEKIARVVSGLKGE
jgi:hypothetical protein